MLDTIIIKQPKTVGNMTNFKPSQKQSEPPIELICDICPGPVIEYDKPSILVVEGWQWGNFGTFCPNH